MRVSLRFALENAGYDVESAAHGREALDLLCTSHVMPGVIILDLDMPLMDGQAFLRAIRLEPAFASLPVLLSTGATNTVMPEVTEIIRKPYDMNEILKLVARYCDANVSPAV